MPQLIGICGNMGTGKTTVAKMIQDLAPDSVILPFAGEVKQELHTLLTSYRNGHFFSYKRYMLYGTQEEKNLTFFVPACLFEEANHRGISLAGIGDEQYMSGGTWYATSGRKLMQWYGTDYRRKMNPNYWMNKWVLNFAKFSDIVLVDDIRFPNEAELVRSLGGYIIKINRDTEHDLAHQSESLIPQIHSHYDIENNFSIDHLESRVFNIASFILPEIGAVHDPRAGSQTMAD